MTTGCKVWLWFIFICNIIAAVSYIATIVILPVTGTICLIAEIIVIIGIALLLFQQRKLGFYLIVVMAVISAIFNIVSGINIALSLISAIIMPAITYYFISKNSHIIR